MDSGDHGNDDEEREEDEPKPVAEEIIIEWLSGQRININAQTNHQRYINEYHHVTEGPVCQEIRDSSEYQRCDEKQIDHDF